MTSEPRPCECAWVEPFGFVPEADCPVHDNAEFVARMNREFGAASYRTPREAIRAESRHVSLQGSRDEYGCGPDQGTE